MFKFIIRSILSGFLSYITQAGLKATGVPLDIWIKKIFSSIDYNIAFWLLMFILTCFFLFLTYVPSFISKKRKRQQEIDPSKENKDQQPKLRIDFEENNASYFCNTGVLYDDTQPDKGYVLLSCIWRVAITNLSSSEAVENVEVKLIDVDGCLEANGNKPPLIRLKFTDDHKREQNFVNINPNDCKFVDVIECFMKSIQINENMFFVKNIEKVRDHCDLSLRFKNIEEKDCSIKIKVTGKNVPSESRCFVIGLRDNLIKMWPA